jgi:adenylylsulfate kinase-like enzyme
MARPSPTVLLQHIYEDERALEICEADFTWGVYYKGKPIAIKNIPSVEHPYPGPKYPRVNFQNLAHALRLRDKMNTLFNTEDFSVVRMEAGYTMK